MDKDATHDMRKKIGALGIGRDKVTTYFIVDRFTHQSLRQDLGFSSHSKTD